MTGKHGTVKMMKNLVFKRGETPKRIDYDGVKVKVESIRPFPYFSEKTNYEIVDIVRCPICNQKKWYHGFFLHTMHQTRNSDIEHAKLYVKIMKNRGQSAKALENIMRWTEKHRRGLFTLKKVIGVI